MITTTKAAPIRGSTRRPTKAASKATSSPRRCSIRKATRRTPKTKPPNRSIEPFGGFIVFLALAAAFKHLRQHLIQPAQLVRVFVHRRRHEDQPAASGRLFMKIIRQLGREHRIVLRLERQYRPGLH